VNTLDNFVLVVWR